MPLNFPVIYGSGGGSGYVEDGLFMHNINLSDISQMVTNPSLSLTGCTGEICYSATDVPYPPNSPVGRLLVFAGIVLCLNVPQAAPGADYGLQVFYGTEYDQTLTASVPNLKFGTDKHTYTVTQSGTRTNVYFDGELIGGFDNAGGRTTAYGNITLNADRLYIVTGNYFDIRGYNRALSAAEIAANYAEDVRRYG